VKGDDWAATAVRNAPQPFFTTKSKGTGLGLPNTSGLSVSTGGKSESIAFPAKARLSPFLF